MLQFKILTLLVAAALIHGCAGSYWDNNFDSPDGAWSTGIDTQGGHTPLGTMTFSGNKKATYTYRNGRILFDETDELGKWKGHWIENPWSAVTCSDQMDGSHSWGEAIFQFNDNYTKFQGTYNLCGYGPKSAWDGNRI